MARVAAHLASQIRGRPPAVTERSGAPARIPRRPL